MDVPTNILWSRRFGGQKLNFKRKKRGYPLFCGHKGHKTELEVKKKNESFKFHFLLLILHQESFMTGVYGDLLQ